MFTKIVETPHNCVEQSRKQAGMTQADIALMVNVTRQTIIAIEKGNYTPSVMLALKLAGALKKPIGDLFWL